MTEQSLKEFIAYCHEYIRGDEKGEAQTFLDRFFVALGYKNGYKGAGADCEYRIRNEAKHTTSFADLVWKPRVLIEMKKRGENLEMHLQQAASYWMQLVPDRPQYVILCNFDEFWIYDFNKSVYKPQVIIPLVKLNEHRQSFTFLLPKPSVPLFEREHEDITEQAAEKIALAYKSMVNRKAAKPEVVLRYILQCIIAMFAEDVELLPDKIFSRIIDECEKTIDSLKPQSPHAPAVKSKSKKSTAVELFGSSFSQEETEEQERLLRENKKEVIDKVAVSYDLIGGLFRAMNDEGITPAGKYKGVEYFNGGLFSDVQAIELTEQEVHMLHAAAGKDWKRVNPSIFGTIFEQALEKDGERHKLGAHYTHEVDIKKIVDPVIVQPWMERIEAAETIEEHLALLTELSEFKVLDPACGSGNFLFIAFKEMKLLERKLLSRIRERYTRAADAAIFKKFLLDYRYVSTDQFYGYDIKPFAVELAKVTLMVAKELSILDGQDVYDNKYKALPLDNLDQNIMCCDALLTEEGGARQWVPVDAIIGNPPYQSKRNMQAEFGADYANKLRSAYPEIPGRADFCVWWFYKAHQTINENAFAGLVGTNTITQNYSREGSLDYMVNHGAEIVNAYASFKWTGEAVVTVSIVNWKKGRYDGERYLYTQVDPKKDFVLHKVNSINSSLSIGMDLTNAYELKSSKEPKMVFQGQVPGEKEFLIDRKLANSFFKDNKKNHEVVKAHLIADDLLANYNSQPSRFCVDFSNMDQIKASTYKLPFSYLKEYVLPKKQLAAQEQEAENEIILKRNPKAKVNKHHINFYKYWWHLAYAREDMIERLGTIKRYIACSGVSKRNIFEFVSTEIIPNAAVFAFCFEDDYSFGIIQSSTHWEWWKAKCSTFETRLRYTSNTVWDTFPWPQQPTEKQIAKVAKASKALRVARNEAMQAHQYSLRDLYRIVEQPGKNPIKDLHTALDKAVAEAYGFIGETTDVEGLLSFLLELNKRVHEAEEKGKAVTAPGLPDYVKDKENYISEDCVRFEW